MPLYTAFGINGVGKDTVLREVQKEIPGTRLISETKLLMYGLNILAAYDESVRPTRDDYVRLEAVPQPDIKIVEESFSDILSAEAADSTATIMTSHLIPAQLLGTETVYLVKPKPSCLHILSRALIQYTASPESVMKRRNGDVRDRGSLGVEDLMHHQRLCDDEWLRLQAEALAAGSAARFVTIPNEDLRHATDMTVALISGDIR